VRLHTGMKVAAEILTIKILQQSRFKRLLSRILSRLVGFVQAENSFLCLERAATADRVPEKTGCQSHKQGWQRGAGGAHGTKRPAEWGRYDRR
jgi:hypothetical protein